MSLVYPFHCQRYSLSATDAERDDTLVCPVALHGVQETRREHCARRTDRVSMGDRAAFHVDHVRRQTRLSEIKTGCGRNEAQLALLEAGAWIGSP